MKKIALTIILIYSPLSLAESNPLTICMDDNWFPYTIVSNEKISGIHTDVIQQALVDIDVPFTITPKPWGRCLAELQSGKVDAIYPASYKAERADFAYYPKNAETDRNSPWRLSQVEHVLVTKDKLAYEYQGDLLSLPQPVGMGISGAFTDTLEDAGLKVKRNKTSDANIKMLARGRVQSVAMNPLHAAIFKNSKQYAGQLKVHKQALRSKSYFLIFSKDRNISESMRERIWNAISAVRGDENVMPYFIYRYLDEKIDIDRW